jgi:hypothetical protein
MNDQDHSLSLSDPDRSLVLSHLLVNFLKNLVSCQTSFTSIFLSNFFVQEIVDKISLVDKIINFSEYFFFGNRQNITG